ncbi:MAG: uracil-DNA glycosylase [Mariprofundaceae bacterium]|nr:uracil-DNA glycosylase [Mariprofundaceae bacterium]
MKTPVSLLFSALEREKNIQQAVNKPIEKLVEIENSITNLETLKQQALVCEQCNLASMRSCVSFGSGDKHADVLLVADVPHLDHHAQDDVFTGDASLLLNQMLMAMGLQREQVYVTPIIQCATPDHRDPNEQEWEACQTWLQQKIHWIQPKVILLMGRVAAQMVLQSDKPLHDLRGQWHDYQDVPVRVLYHPLYLLRSPRQKQGMWEDLLVVQECLR